MTWLQLVPFGVGAAAALVGWLFARGAHWQWRLVTALLLASFGIAGAAVVLPTHVDAELERALPTFVEQDGYRSSNACRSCHPGQYESWHDSFHRTMTQVASPVAIAAPFDGRILRERGRAFVLVEAEEKYYIGELDGAHEGDFDLSGAWWDRCTRVWRVMMTTGSHHLQGYWVRGDDGRLQQFPFVFLVREGRWMANSDSFLQPPPDEDEELRRYVWADECAVCHSTGGPWDASDERPRAAVTELGISCEACHGPAEEHARLNASPMRRYSSRWREDGDPSITNPTRLDHVRSASVCGRCHGVHPDTVEGAGADAFLPGDRLMDLVAMQQPFDVVEAVRVAEDPDEVSDADREMAGAFWDDGTVRVAGREYTGMIRSGCYTEGEMACVSCHSMHEGDPERQIDPEAPGDAMCTNCHGEIASDIGAHTHHEESSEGSRCINCHMPYVSYGLLAATRSHRMDGPTTSGRRTRGRPNACNLCHLDRPLGWTADHLESWYGQERPELETAHETVPAGVVWMLTGDAAQRGVVAWNVSWGPAGEASELDEVRPALALLLEDQYSAVRQIAGRAVLNLDSEAPVDLDALTRDPSESARQTMWERWPPTAALPEATLRELSARRDDTPTWVSE